MTKDMLNKQIEQKHKRSFREKEEDMNYAMNVRKNVEAQEALERKKLEIHRQEMQKYKETLEKQIEDTNKKKLFKDVMSEHERKVNSLDLDAYEKMDLHLHSKLVGVKDISEMSSNFPSPGFKQPSDALSKIETSPSMDYNLIRKINMVDNVIRKDTKRFYNNEPQYDSSSRVVKLALQNMLDPRVKYMRNNTHNRAYGYKGENYFDFNGGGINRSLTMVNEKLSSEDQPKTYRNNPLTNAGIAQIANNIPSNGFTQRTHENYLSGKAMPELGEQSLQRVYTRRQAPIRQRYANYNIITGADNASMY